MEDHSSRLDSFLRFKDRMIAIIHPIQTRRIHLLMSEEHLIASTVKTLCRGMRYPNCDIRALFMISINFQLATRGYPAGPERSRKIPRAHGGCLGTGSR